MDQTFVEAFWETMRGVHFPDMKMTTLDRLREIIPVLSSEAGGHLGGQVLASTLLGTEWDWPMWNAYAVRVGHDYPGSIRAEVAALSPTELLSTITIAELKKLMATIEGAPSQSATAKKGVIIESILRGAPHERIEPMIEQLRSDLLQRRLVRCRQQMMRYLMARMTRVAYHIHRYEQLNNAGLAKLRPCWMFYRHSGDFDSPVSCEKLDGLILPAMEAKRIFPRLPCDHLTCSCSIAAVACPTLRAKREKLGE